MHFIESLSHRLRTQRNCARAHFLHVGKTGGTAIKCSLSSARKLGSYNVLLHRHSTRLDQIPRGEKVFFFLRDPLKRFVSGFYSRRRKGRPRYWVPWSRAEARAFAMFGSANELAEALDDVKQCRRESAESAMKGIYHVNKSVWYWLRNRDYFVSRLEDVLFIGFQESLEHDFGLLVAALGLSAELRLPSDPVKAHRNVYSSDSNLSDRAIRNLNVYYAEDIRFIGHVRSVLQEDANLKEVLEKQKNAILRLKDRL